MSSTKPRTLDDIGMTSEGPKARELRAAAASTDVVKPSSRTIAPRTVSPKPTSVATKVPARTVSPKPVSVTTKVPARTVSPKPVSVTAKAPVTVTKPLQASVRSKAYTQKDVDAAYKKALDVSLQYREPIHIYGFTVTEKEDTLAAKIVESNNDACVLVFLSPDEYASKRSVIVSKASSMLGYYPSNSVQEFTYNLASNKIIYTNTKDGYSFVEYLNNEGNLEKVSHIILGGWDADIEKRRSSRLYELIEASKWEGSLILASLSLYSYYPEGDYTGRQVHIPCPSVTVEYISSRSLNLTLADLTAPTVLYTPLNQTSSQV
jgi:hypothetical protein